MFDGKSLLITGATGSFGRHFVGSILRRYQPQKIVVYSRDELKQFEMQQDYNEPCMRYFLGDVRDRDRLTQAMEGIDYVVHAAALKQVPAAEYNPMECIRTNVHGAENVTRAAATNNVKRVIALSTDKAANPINLYGASKLASDKLFVAANNMVGPRDTRYSVVRYGNVVGSRGSVIPYFKRLIDGGARELPLTDPEMTRFWIDLDQGVNFVIDAFARMKGGEVYVPKIPSMRITDLAKAMAPDLPTKTIGMRPGEKLHEILCPADSAHLTIDFQNHYVIMPTIIFNGLEHSYLTDATGDTGQYVKRGFEYNSSTNPHFLNTEEVRRLSKTYSTYRRAQD